MVPFQGNLKKRTEQDIKELTDSLLSEGLMMPFAIWKHEGKNYLLDGHGRKEAITKLAVEDAKLLSEEWPVIYVNADTEDEARKALLQITSSYGKVTRSGYKQFCVSIPEYRAPVIQKFVSKPKTESKPVQKPKSDKTILKIRVMNDRVNQVLDIFKQFNFIEVL
jgi:hypothetical protein